MATMNVDFLIPQVRLKIGDLNPTAYRYLDEWIVAALIVSVRALQRRWKDKYIVNDKGVVSRNLTSGVFVTEESAGVIEDRDESVIVLRAAIEILGGSLENSAWNIASWRDAEISYTNLDAGRIRENRLKDLIKELDDIIKPPGKRLAQTQGGKLPGFLNEFERDTKL